MNLRRLDIAQIAELRNSRFVCSVWDRENERISDSPFDRGRKVITFNNILKYNTFPLAEIVTDILHMGAEEMRCPVEVEFAVNMDVAPGEQQIFNLLQIRPIIDNQDNRPIDWSEVDTSDALVYGENALGIGMMSDISDVIYIKSGTFSSLSTEKIADETAGAEPPHARRKNAPTYSSVPAAGVRRIRSSAYPSSGTTSPKPR